MSEERSVNKMKNSLIYFQFSSSIIGIAFGIYVTYVAYLNGIDGRADLEFGRYILATILIFYATTQLIKVSRKKFSKLNTLTFPWFYLVIGVFVESTHRGISKNWAPMSEFDALMESFLSLLTLLILVVLATFTYRSAK